MSDELEYSLSQYHDGTLGPVERAALDEILATDAAARELLAEYQRLDALMRQTPGAPELNWQLLQSRISSSLANEELEAPTYRIGVWTRRLAVAAGILLAIGITIPMLHRTDRGSLRHNPSIAIEVNAPQGATFARNTALPEITIGPSPQVAGATWQYDDAFNTRPSRVAIAVSPQDGQDVNTSAPF